MWMFSSWGFFAHKLINRHAVFSLPSELAAFYKIHIHEITERAIDADKRCYVDSNEAPRHYIDINDFEEETIDSIPIHWSKAKEKYNERNLIARGIVPWQINFTYNNLVKAFAEKDFQKIIRYTADLGHYVADAHVPLHTTNNYNGQKTGQIGIHAFWESRLPEQFASTYNLLIGKAEYVDDPLSFAWSIVKESNQLVDQVLDTELKLSQSIPASYQRGYINRNNILLWTYSNFYAESFHTALEGMVERRMRASIWAVSSLWYSAWVDAGQPSFPPATEKIKNATDSISIEKVKKLGREEFL